MKNKLWLNIILSAFCLFFILTSSVQAANLSNAFDQNNLGAAAGSSTPLIVKLISIY